MYFSTLFLAHCLALQCRIYTLESTLQDCHSNCIRPGSETKKASFPACVRSIRLDLFNIFPGIEPSIHFPYHIAPSIVSPDRLSDHLSGRLSSRKRYLVKTMANKAESSLFANQNATVSWSYALVELESGCTARPI